MPDRRATGRFKAFREDFAAPAAPKSSTIVALAGLGVAAAFALMYADRPFTDWSRADRAFVETAQFKLWLLIVCLQIAGWSVAAIFVWRVLKRVWRFRDGYLGEIAVSSAVLVSLLAGFAVAARTWGVDYGPLFGLSGKTLVLAILGGAVALGAAVAMWLAHAALEKRVQNPRGPVTAQERIERFVTLREEIQRLLTIQGAILAGAIIGAGALREALQAYKKSTAFPDEYVLLYGVFLSGLVALCYAPGYARMRTVGERLRDEAAGAAPSPSTSEWSDWYDRRSKLTEMLALDVGSFGALRTGVAILAPLGAGLAGLLPGAG